MPFNATHHHRQSIRLQGYDYTYPGAYFVTLVTEGREELFGEIVDGELTLSFLGRCAEKQWRQLPARFTHIDLDAFVVMPNHVHGIIVIREADRQGDHHPPGVLQAGGLGAMVRAYKSSVTLRFHQMRGCENLSLWQRNYYEHVIRGDADLERLRLYIQSNPMQWSLDQENPRP